MRFVVAAHIVMDRRRQRIIGAVGVAGPGAFVAAFALLGAMWGGYDPVSQYISELGASGAPRAMIMNAAFLFAGGSLIALAYGLHTDIAQGRGSPIGPAFLALAGVGLGAAGVVHCDPGCPIPGDSWHGVLHHVFALGASFGLTLAPLITGLRMERDGDWSGYRRFSIGAAAVAIAINFFSPGIVSVVAWEGVLQRAVVVVTLAWAMVVAARLYALNTDA